MATPSLPRSATPRRTTRPPSAQATSAWAHLPSDGRTIPPFRPTTPSRETRMLAAHRESRCAPDSCSATTSSFRRSYPIDQRCSRLVRRYSGLILTFLRDRFPLLRTRAALQGACPDVPTTTTGFPSTVGGRIVRPNSPDEGRSDCERAVHARIFRPNSTIEGRCDQERAVADRIFRPHSTIQAHGNRYSLTRIDWQLPVMRGRRRAGTSKRSSEASCLHVFAIRPLPRLGKAMREVKRSAALAPCRFGRQPIPAKIRKKRPGMIDDPPRSTDY